MKIVCKMTRVSSHCQTGEAGGGGEEGRQGGGGELYVGDTEHEEEEEEGKQEDAEANTSCSLLHQTLKT